MSIYAYTGLPGSGKSYVVTEHQILPALKAGRRVVTNVELNWELCRKDFPKGELVELPLDAIKADPAKIYEYVTPGSVLVLDEVWKIFEAGTKANKVPEPFRKLLAEHRHMVNDQGESCQIVLVTQDLAQIAAFARQLVEVTFRATKLSTMGMSGQYRLDVFPRAVTGPNPPLERRIRELYGRYHKGVWKYYQSHTMRDSAGSGANEKPVDDRANFLKSKWLLAAAAAAVLAAVWSFPKLYDLATGKTKIMGDKQSVTAVLGGPEGRPSTPATVGALVPTIAPGMTAASPATQSLWRVAGFVRTTDPATSKALLTDGQQTVTIPYGDCGTDMETGRFYCLYKRAKLWLIERWHDPVESPWGAAPSAEGASSPASFVPTDTAP